MITVFKYEIPESDSFEIGMPRGATFLDWNVQRFVPCVWAMVDTHEPIVMRKFRMYGTGRRIADGECAKQKHVGTLHLNDGALVFHVFEVLS